MEPLATDTGTPAESPAPGTIEPEASGKPTPSPPRPPPLILSRAEHRISRKDIHENALRVLYRLASLGYRAYLVGGGVRDLMLGKVPKDFDVATDARPSRLKKIFRNCRIIGRRFRIAHVYFPDGDIIEVSTFRQGSPLILQTSKGAVVSDNEYGTSEEDALRRDLTINGLFYDIATFSVIDYVGGVRDLRDRIIRTIADPDSSFKEDPVRMIRVERHAARTGFEIEPETLRAIFKNRDDIRTANPARLLEETMKDLRGGAAAPFFRLTMETHLLDSLLPTLAQQLRNHGPEHPFWKRMETLDRRVLAGASYTTPLLLSVYLHTVLFPDPRFWAGQTSSPPDVWRYIQSNWRGFSKTIRISRRDMERIAQILISYRKLIQSAERKRLLPALLRKTYLSESLDFLEIDLEARGLSTHLIAEWRQHASPPPRPEPRYRVFGGEPREGRGRRRGRRERTHDDALEGDGPELPEHEPGEHEPGEHEPHRHEPGRPERGRTHPERDAAGQGQQAAGKPRTRGRRRRRRSRHRPGGPAETR